MKKILFCQFHNEVINGHYEKDIADKYYNGIYKCKEKDGYYKTPEFFELPLWIAEIKGSLTDNFKSELLIIKDLKTAQAKIEKLNPDYILFSVLDINKGYIKDIIKQYKGNALFMLGGYIDFSYFDGLKNYKVFDTVKNFIQYLGMEYKYNLDYTLFKGFKTVPRLTLSKGCLNRCKFCIVEKTLTEYSKRDIIKQIKAFKPLKFKLVYLNDKTFGQAQNYKLLPLIYKRIKKYNPLFKGFIIQTTCNKLQSAEFKRIIKNGHVKICELGIESFNNELLRNLRKPQNEKTIEQAINKLIKLDIKIIPNIIIGLIGETKQTYNKTLDLIQRYKNNIYLLNIYNLALYLNSDLAQNIEVKSDNDLNENSTEKSFYSEQNIKDNKYFYDSIFNIGLELLIS